MDEFANGNSNVAGRGYIKILREKELTNLANMSITLNFPKSFSYSYKPFPTRTGWPQ